MVPIIYHNPKCGTSRNVLAVLEAAGYRPNIIEYITEGYTRSQLTRLLTDSGMNARQALRETKSPAKEMGLLDHGIADEVIFEAMLKHPILVNRPFVVTTLGTRLCRPSEIVLDLIEKWPSGPYYKEDGSLMIDENGQRI